MNTFLNILFKTSDTFDYLDDQFEDQLETNANLLFMLAGAVSGIDSFFKDYHHFQEYPLLIVFLGFVLATAGIGLLMGRYLSTYILYGIGKLLNGKGKIIDMRVVVAYSVVPIFMKFPVVLYLGITGDLLSPKGYLYWIISLYYLIIWLWTLKIMIQGVMRFNGFGFIKGVINVSPYLILGGITFIVIVRNVISSF
ncbi:YIP1 family protein [Marinifilum flexuosum]|uniref:Yip1-like protein n=1 Tax=Marinifilum flexuosum TaxID=1117708 RepID=A0A419WFC5_9BACT|nr:YIP1 family protein [Marinifilum flexuosum]RKD94092.1 Yip1-like protein [Marinifilum flexuosum]